MISQVCNDAEQVFDLAPWAKFACLFAALIRDLGAPKTPGLDGSGGDVHMVERSIVDRSSVLMVYDLFMNNKFRDLRKSLCSTKSEFSRFWRTVQNLTLATDESGSSLSVDRDQRWKQVWGGSSSTPYDKRISVFKHIVLLSQETHAVQHWDNFKKWSQALLLECTEAGKEVWIVPKSFWQKTQLEYFDQVMVPLTKKMEQTGVLGFMGTEFSSYANQNREELASTAAGAVEQAKAPSLHHDSGEVKDEVVEV